MSAPKIETPMAALREVERRLLPSMTPRETTAAWDAHREQWLPESLTPGEAQEAHNAFEAGYSTAMAVVRRELAAVQTIALRSKP